MSAADLVTERLVLHPLTVAEAEGLVAGTPAPEAPWARGYPSDTDMAGAQRYLAICHHSGDPRPFGAYEIRRRDDGHAIGGLGFHGGPGDTGTVTIGYGLIPAARGRGYAAESLRGLLRFARESGVRAAEGDTTRANIASQHVMSAAGMRLVAEDDDLKYYRITWENGLRRGNSV